MFLRNYSIRWFQLYLRIEYVLKNTMNNNIFRHSRRCHENIPEIMWFEEGNDLIRSCAALSSALGIQKSFSTSDISQLPGPDTLHLPPLHHHHPPSAHQMTTAVSEMALNSLQRCGYMLDNPRLDHASRSCSTWVAVGELASTSQLPSPHGGPANNVTHPLSSSCTPPPPAFTTADLIRSVNKNVRQNYIRRRLLTTYRAIERLSQSEFNLDRLEAAAAAATASLVIGPGPTELVVPAMSTLTLAGDNNNESDCGAVAGTSSTDHHQKCASVCNKSTSILVDPALVKHQISQSMHKQVTVHDIEKERGKPLTKYDRNMMIFNWLHTLEETPSDDDLTETIAYDKV